MGGIADRFTTSKRNLKIELHVPQAMDCLSTWKSPHHTQEETRTRQNRGQCFIVSQLEKKKKKKCDRIVLSKRETC